MEKLVTNPEVRELLIVGARGYSPYHTIKQFKVQGRWVPESEFRKNGGKTK